MTVVKRLRIGYYISMAILLIAGLGSGRWEFYFLFTILALLVIFTLVLNLWTIFSFSYSQELSASSVVKGASPVLKISVLNNKPFAFVMLRAIVQTPPPGQWADFIVNLDPGAKMYCEIPVHCKYRGVYDVGLAVLETSDVFGLLRIRFDLRRLPRHRQEQITVYPRLLQIPVPRSPMQSSAAHKGSGSQRLTQDGESFSDTRKYLFGDPFKRVHRIISARKRQLFVKRYDLPMETGAIIAIDSRENGLAGEDALRYSDIACECAAAIAHHCLGAGYLTTLIGLDTNQPVIEGSSSRDFSGFYYRLAVMKFGTGDDIAAALRFNTGTLPGSKMVYVISSREDKALADCLSALASAGNQVRMILPLVGERAENRRAGGSIPGVAVSAITGAEDIAHGFGRDGATERSGTLNGNSPRCE